MSPLLISVLPSVGLPEIIFVLIIVLIIFGPKSLPSLGKAMGQGLREFKSASHKLTDALDEAARDEEEKERQAKKGKESRQIPAERAAYVQPEPPKNSVPITPAEENS